MNPKITRTPQTNQRRPWTRRKIEGSFYLHPNRYRHGFTSIALVSAFAIIISISLLAIFRTGLIRRDKMAKAQLRADYQQREESLIRAIVAVFPQKVIDCMKADLSLEPKHNWNSIFAEAVSISNSGTSIPETEWNLLALTDARRGDVADTGNDQVQGWITSLEGVAGEVTPGTITYENIFAREGLTGRIPPLLTMSDDLQARDARCPIIDPKKVYAYQSPGLLASVDRYPGFNLIPYPDIRFGYADPGQPFVAKRNWWAFQVSYGLTTDGTQPPVPVITKRYILSLYEIPSQMPIEAATFAEVGRHQNGSKWNANTIQITGSIYADRLRMNDSFGAERLTGRQAIEIENALNLGDSIVGADFDGIGIREQLQVALKRDVLPVALSSNSGRLTFIPIQRGGHFLHEPEKDSLWEAYTRGASQCSVIVSAIGMTSISNQTPIAIRVTFQDAQGGEKAVVLRRGDNWPSDLEPGAEFIPFQTELTLTHSAALAFFPERLNTWLVSQGGAPVTTNRSIYVKTDSSVDPLTVRSLPAPDAIPDVEDMSVVIRKGQNLTAYGSGLSIVTPFRVYVGDDFNAVPFVEPPVASGLPSEAEYFPPMSVFAGELRIGPTSFLRPYEHRGQLGTLIVGGLEPWQPLDVKSGSDDAVHPDGISAELTPLQSPAELPPIHQMNWLITIEEIPQD